MRRTCLTMAQNWHTPVGYWLDMHLVEFRQWLTANNELLSKSEESE